MKRTVERSFVPKIQDCSVVIAILTSGFNVHLVTMKMLHQP